MRQLSILLLSSLLINYGNSQVIRTFIVEGKDVTFGNSNLPNIDQKEKTLYGLLPSFDKINFQLDERKAWFIENFDRFLDHYLITDLANIDPKDFNPQMRGFAAAVQRRSDPFIMMSKLLICAAFVMFFIRLQYGHMGGFKKQVLRLRDRNIRAVKFNRGCALFFMIFFGILWFGCLSAANVFDTSNIIDFANEINDMTKHTAKVSDTMQTNFNAQKYTDYYSDKSQDDPAFTIDYVLRGGALETNLEEDSSNAIDQFDHFSRWYLIFGLFWWLTCIIMISVHKSQQKRRVVAVSLLIAGIYILLLTGGLMLIGFKFSEISVKSEICNQAMNVTQYGQSIESGNGISNFVQQIDNPYTIQKTQGQLAVLMVAVNTAYTIYQNRLVALGDLKTYTEIKSGKYVKTLLKLFKTNYITDHVLKEQYFILQDLWTATTAIRYVYSERPLQYWAYQLTDTVCYGGQIADLFAQGFLFLVCVGLFFAFIMAWGSEYILRCIIFEEESNIDMNKNRYDWC